MEEFADHLVKTVVLKLKAMEEADSGLLAKSGVTVADRIAVILNTVKPQYAEPMLRTKPRKEDLRKVAEIMKEEGLEATKEEVVLLAVLRRFTIAKTRSGNLTIFLSKILDTEPEETAKATKVST